MLELPELISREFPSEDLRASFVRAFDAAKSRGHSAASEAQVLRELLREKDSLCFQVCLRLVDPSNLIRQLDDVLDSMAVNVDEHYNHKALRWLLVRAAHEAFERSECYLASSHVLLAMLRNPGPELAVLFSSHALTHKAFSEELD